MTGGGSRSQPGLDVMPLHQGGLFSLYHRTANLWQSTVEFGPMPLSSRIAGLDGLRALAALAVFSVHFNQIVRLDQQLGPFDIARLLANGEHGVSLFFTLSGFLLCLPFWQALAAGGGLPNLKVYVLRRAARILPAYYGALTLLVLLSGMWRFPPVLPDIGLHYAFLFNLTEFSIFSINAPFWTLAVEVQFYALLPLMFGLIAKAASRWRLGSIVALGVGTYFAHYWLMSSVTRIVIWPFEPMLIWIRPYGAVLSHSVLAHLPHFILGVIAGCLHLKTERLVSTDRVWLQRISEPVFWCALVLVLVFTGTPLEEPIQIPYGRYGLPLVPLLLAVMIGSLPLTSWARRCFDARPLRGLGIISYGVYIYHLPCLTLIDRIMARNGWDAAEHPFTFAAAGLTLTVLVAAVSFTVLERPTIRAARRFA